MRKKNGKIARLKNRSVIISVRFIGSVEFRHVNFCMSNMHDKVERFLVVEWFAIQSLDLPKTLSDFFQHAVNVVYAVVIGLSFSISREAVIPVENISSHIISTEILFLGYYIVVTGWIGYFLAIKTKPHQGILGISRFGIDLFILYLFYYIISLADPKNIQYRQDVFLYILPITYGVYLLWDIVRYYEYRIHRSSPVIKKKGKRWIGITIDYFIIFLFLALFYYVTLSYVRDRSTFIIDSIFVFTTMYRRAKWKEMGTRRASTRRKRNIH
jgi:hypothetical protein